MNIKFLFDIFSGTLRNISVRFIEFFFYFCTFCRIMGVCPSVNLKKLLMRKVVFSYF